MRKEFIVNIIFLIAINAIIKPFYVFGIDLKVQNEVNNYGLYFSLLSFSYLFQIISDFGLYQYNNRKIARYNFLFEKYFSHIVILKGFLSIIFLLFSFLFAILLGYEAFELYLLLFILLNQILITYIFYFRSNISGLQYYKTDSIISVLDKIIVIVICIPLLWLRKNHDFKIEWFVYAQTISFLFTFLIALSINYFLKTKAFVFRPSIATMVVLLKKSFPYSLIVILMSLYTRIDIIMIERMLYDELSNKGILEANIYAAAYRLLESFNMLILLFNGLLLPMFSKLIKENKDFVSLYKLSAGIVIILTVSISLAFIINSDEIMVFLYKDYSPSMSSVAIVLMVGFNAMGLAFISGTLLTANGSLKEMNIIFIKAIVINFLLNYCLIPDYGAKGAAFSTLITQIFVFFSELFTVKKLFQLPINFSFIFRIILFLFLSGLIAFAIESLSVLWICSVLITGVAIFFAGLVLKIIDYYQILKIFKYK